MNLAGSPLDAAQLSHLVQGVDSSARLVPRRLVRRAIRWHFGLSSSQKPPHDICFEIPRDSLLGCISPADLGDSTTMLPERVLLLPLPDDEEQTHPESVLTDLWRRLFHAAIDRVIEQRGGGFADNPTLFNATVRHEIQTVLLGENRLPPPEDERTLFREFAAFFLELEFFAPEQVEVYFPGFLHPEHVSGWFNDRLGAESIFDATRPVGAADPGILHHSKIREEPPRPHFAGIAVSEKQRERITADAGSAIQKGNDVRAAICLRMIDRPAEAHERLRLLVARMQKALQFPDALVEPWYQAIVPLLDLATSQGFWDVQERALYELQKACLDIERKVFAVDLMEYVASFGKLSLKRLLEKPREVNVLRRLRAALKLATRANISLAEHQAIEHLLHQAIRDCENRVRRENRPVLNHVLDEVGMLPANQAERIARNKMIEELLDVLCSRGFLKMSDLRDAIARNRLKLDDLTGPKEFITGDPLLRANSLLAVRMDGIYRRGEIYLRALQRGSSLAFGTLPGRLFTKFIALPFGGAFVLLEGLHHFIEAIAGISQFVVKHLTGDTSEPQADHGKSWMTEYPTIFLVGFFLLALIHLPVFRKQVGRVARKIVIDIPSAIYHSPLVRALFNNPAIRFFTHYLLTPCVVGGLVAFTVQLVFHDWQLTILLGICAALLVGIFFRTSWGRGLEERLDESLSRVWRVLSVNFLIGVLTLILTIFMYAMEWLERGMYAVDEWLRFREGDSPVGFVFKLIFGTIWSIFTYIFRFAWNLLIEPQINPIKHFPVVTVSHKLLLPMIGSLAKAFKVSVETMTTIVFGIPGIFGFLVWELKENWKLYRANRPKSIGAVAVGSHGERVRALLRPGLHSGVIPKTLAKLRKAEGAGNHVKAAKLHHRLKHVAEAVHQLVEREMVAYLRASRRWGGLPIHIDRVLLATNRLRCVFTLEHRSGEVVVSIEERGGWLIGSIEQSGWLDQLSDKQLAAFNDGLLGLYKLAGVHVMREHAARLLGIEPYRLDCRPEGLLALPRDGGQDRVVTIDYGDSPTMTSSASIDGRPPHTWPVADFVLTERGLDWQRWVERWEQDHAGKMPIGALLQSPAI
ncbi:MAG: hypothetical protein K8T89_15980 [Planctomycetes bacterium]|nr:hypothetical protein [Planctomycetota bacterium]